jgi:hypothetical protein
MRTTTPSRIQSPYTNILKLFAYEDIREPTLDITIQQVLVASLWFYKINCLLFKEWWAMRQDFLSCTSVPRYKKAMRLYP